MSQKTAPRLTPQEWLDTGMRALATIGPKALKAEIIAKHLGATKGSFYWHFKDVPAYQTAILDTWEAQSLERLSDILSQDATTVHKLRRSAQLLAEPDGFAANLETAIRAWAKSNDIAAGYVARVDQRRQNILQKLLNESGVGNPEMARIVFAAGVGMQDMGGPSPDEKSQSMGSLVDLVLALR